MLCENNFLAYCANFPFSSVLERKVIVYSIRADMELECESTRSPLLTYTAMLYKQKVRNACSRANTSPRMYKIRQIH